MRNIHQACRWMHNYARSVKELQLIVGNKDFNKINWWLTDEHIIFESWVLRKKETFSCVIFSKICYIASVINHTSKLICLHACLRKHNCAGLIDKPKLHVSKVIWLKNNCTVTEIFFWHSSYLMQFNQSLMRLKKFFKETFCTPFQWIFPEHNTYNISILTLLGPNFKIYQCRVVPISFFVLGGCQFGYTLQIYVFSYIFTVFAFILHIF